MKKILQMFVVCSFLLTASQVSALTDTYFATGEDLEYLIESDNTLALLEIEYELRRFTFFRKVEDYLYNLKSDYSEEDDSY